MTNKPDATGYRWSLALRQLTSISTLAMAVFALAAAELSRSGLAADTGNSGTPAACSSLTSPGTYQNIDGPSDDIFISGFVAGATVTVAYRNNRGGGSSYQATVTQISSLGITPAGAGPATLGNNQSGSTTFSHVSGSGTLQLRVAKSSENNSPDPEYRVICAPPPPGLTLSKSTLSVSEAGTTSDTLTVRLATQPTADVTVAVSSNDASEGAITTPTTLTFTAINWNTAQNVTLQAVNDDLDDGDIPYNVVLNPASASDIIYNGLSNTNVSATTLDDDTRGVTVSPTTVSAMEGAATGNFTVFLTSQPTATVTISLAPGAQCTLSSSGLTFTTANWNTAQPVTVTAVNDTVVEGAHICSITTGNASGGDYAGFVVADVTANITDNDTATATIAKSASGDGAEPGDDGAFTVTLSAPSASDTVVSFTPGGTAQAGGDYTALSGSVTVPAGATTAAIPVDVLDDSTVEGTETVSVSLAGTSNGLISASGSASLDIADNDTATASIAKSADGDGAEPGDDGAFTVTLSAASATATVVNFTPGGTAQAGGDYTALSGSVTVPAGATTAAIPVDVLDDLTVEGTETVSVSLDGTSNGLISASGSASLDISDNDTATATIAKSASGDGAEPGDDGAFTVTLSAASATDTVVNFTPGGTAQAGGDYTALSGSVTVPAGSTTAAIPVEVLDDSTVEGTETVSVSLAGTSNGLISASGSASLDIADNDTATASIAKSADGDGAEPGDNGAFTVTLSAASATATVVNFTPGGTAQAGGDYTALSGSVTVPAGATTAAIPVDVLDDVTVEGTETVSVSLDGTSNGLISASGSASLDIADNDTATATIAKSASGDGAEPGDDGAFTVTLSAASATDTVVNFTPGGTAQAGSDYTALPGSVTVPAGSTTAAVLVDVLDDVTVEGTETVSVSLAGTSNGLISASGSASLDIADNDTATATIAKSADGDGAEPGDDGAFTVTLSAPSAADTVVSYTVTGTAQAGSDYTTLAGSVTVLAGNLTAVIPVDIVDNATVEGTETVSVELTGTSNASIQASGSASLDITDDDTATAGIAKSSGGDGAEPGDDGEFTVTLSAASATDTVVSYTVTGTAQAGSDYTTLAGSVTVLAGNLTAVIPVDIVDNATVEGTETVSVELTGTSNASIQASGSASLDITDDDTATAGIAKSSGGDGAEPNDDGEFTVTLSAASAADTVVSYTVTGTAQAGSDYTALPGSVTVPAGSTTAAVLVDVLDDVTVEGTETVSVSLAGTSNGLISASGSASLDIADNDTATATIAKSVGGDGAEPGDDGAFTVTLSAPSPTDTVVNLTPGGTAQAGSDYTALPGSVTVPAGSTTAAVLVDVLDDVTVEGTETVSVSLAGTSNGLISASGSASLDIADNDTATATIAKSADGDGAEPGDDGEFTVTLSAPSPTDTVVNLTPGGTAQAGGDYTALPGSVTVPAGSTTAAVPVDVLDDLTVEGTETVSVSLAGTSNGLISASGSASLDIADNDAAVAADETLVQKTFESETQNFMAARMRLLARLGPRTHRMANREDGGFQAGGNGFNIQGENGNLVGDFALNSGAVQRIVRGDFLNVTPTADVVEASGPVNAWIEGQFAFYKSDDDDEGDTDGNYFVGYAGVDVRVHDGVVIGVMGQLDWLDEDGDTGKTDGDGWMIGPYLSAELAPNLFLDLRGMYGQSDNSSTQQIQGFEYQGDFDTERLLLEIVLSGRFDYGSAVMTPDLQFIYIWDDQQDYSVSSGADVVDVDGQLVKLGQLSSGLKVAQKWDAEGTEIWPYLGGRLFWDFDNPGTLEIDGDTVSTDEIRAAVSVGVDVSTEDTQISIEATYDGLFADDYESIGGRLSIGHRF